MLVKLQILFVGRPKDDHANALAGEYVKRVNRFVRCEMLEIKPDRSEPWPRGTNTVRVLLDPSGRLLDSAEFARMVEKAATESRDIVFVIGGADGAPEQWRKQADFLLSLSPLTLPHELARVVLAEQLYRAVATWRGHPYPR